MFIFLESFLFLLFSSPCVMAATTNTMKKLETMLAPWSWRGRARNSKGDKCVCDVWLCWINHYCSDLILRLSGCMIGCFNLPQNYCIFFPMNKETKILLLQSFVGSCQLTFNWGKSFLFWFLSVVYFLLEKCSFLFWPKEQKSNYIWKRIS